MSELTTFVYSVAALAVSGLTFLAYKEPAGYRRVIAAVSAASSAGLFAMIGWNMAISTMVNALYSKLKPYEYREVLKVAQGLIPSIPVLLVWTALAFYATFLWFLPDILHGRKNQRP